MSKHTHSMKTASFKNRKFKIWGEGGGHISQKEIFHREVFLVIKKNCPQLSKKESYCFLSTGLQALLLFYSPSPSKTSYTEILHISRTEFHKALLTLNSPRNNLPSFITLISWGRFQINKHLKVPLIVTINSNHFDQIYQCLSMYKTCKGTSSSFPFPNPLTRQPWIKLAIVALSINIRQGL